MKVPYKVIRGFRDKNTQIHYREGMEYPGGSVSEKRLEELMSESNSISTPVLEEVEGEALVGSLNENNAFQKEFPQHKGGPWYLLSNGEKIQGKEEAIQAEKELT